MGLNVIGGSEGLGEAERRRRVGSNVIGGGEGLGEAERMRRVGSNDRGLHLDEIERRTDVGVAYLPQLLSQTW